VDTITAMKIAGHASDRMHRRYNIFERVDERLATGDGPGYHRNNTCSLWPRNRKCLSFQCAPVAQLDRASAF